MSHGLKFVVSIQYSIYLMSLAPVTETYGCRQEAMPPYSSAFPPVPIIVTDPKKGILLSKPRFFHIEVVFARKLVEAHQASLLFVDISERLQTGEAFEILTKHLTLNRPQKERIPEDVVRILANNICIHFHENLPGLLAKYPSILFYGPAGIGKTYALARWYLIARAYSYLRLCYVNNPLYCGADESPEDFFWDLVMAFARHGLSDEEEAMQFLASCSSISCESSADDAIDRYAVSLIYAAYEEYVDDENEACQIIKALLKNLKKLCARHEKTFTIAIDQYNILYRPLTTAFITHIEFINSIRGPFLAYFSFRVLISSGNMEIVLSRDNRQVKLHLEALTEKPDAQSFSRFCRFYCPDVVFNETMMRSLKLIVGDNLLEARILLQPPEQLKEAFHSRLQMILRSNRRSKKPKLENHNADASNAPQNEQAEQIYEKINFYITNPSGRFRQMAVMHQHWCRDNVMGDETLRDWFFLLLAHMNCGSIPEDLLLKITANTSVERLIDNRFMFWNPNSKTVEATSPVVHQALLQAHLTDSLLNHKLDALFRNDAIDSIQKGRVLERGCISFFYRRTGSVVWHLKISRFHDVEIGLQLYRFDEKTLLDQLRSVKGDSSRPNIYYVFIPLTELLPDVDFFFFNPVTKHFIMIQVASNPRTHGDVEVSFWARRLDKRFSV